MASLVKQLDGILAENQGKTKLCAFVIVMTDDPKAAAASLEKLQKETGARYVALTVLDGTASPRGYGVADGADLTAICWKQTRAAASRGFSAGSLDEAGIAEVLADVYALIGVEPPARQPEKSAPKGF